VKELVYLQPLINSKSPSQVKSTSPALFLASTTDVEQAGIASGSDNSGYAQRNPFVTFLPNGFLSAYEGSFSSLYTAAMYVPNLHPCNAWAL
jgi:hypothetical protein